MIENMQEVSYKIVLEVSEVTSESFLDFVISMGVEEKIYRGIEDSVKHRVVNFVSRFLFVGMTDELIHHIEGEQNQEVSDHFLDKLKVSISLLLWCSCSIFSHSKLFLSLKECMDTNQ